MSSSILTLQFGHYSNYVGTHWWNIQESSFQYDPDNPSEINHDVLYREGVTLNGEVTFTPRLLLVDLKGSLKTLPEDGELYQIPDEETDSTVEVVSEPKPEKIEFQKDLTEFGACQSKKIYDLDNEVRVWSDFLYSRFHPRTVNIIREYQHSSESSLFDIFPLGTNLWKKDQFSEDFVDKIRNYVEECDTFQGFHVLMDASDGFGGLSIACLEHLRDEYDSKSILSFPVNLDVSSQTPLQLLSLALCYDGLIEHTSLFTPLSPTNNFDYLSLKPHLPYHTSAVIASALDTFTLTYRMKNSKHTLLDVCSDFSTSGRKAAATGLNLPFPLKTNEDLIDCLDVWEGPLVKSITPNCQINPDNSLQLVALRGIPESRLKRPLQFATKQRDMSAYQCETVEEMLNYYLMCSCYGSKSGVTVSGEQMKVGAPFPKFFDGRVGRTGDVDLGGGGGEVESVSVLAGLHTGKFVGQMFDVLSKDLEKVKYRKFHQFDSEGVEGDQFKECFDRILDLRDCYEDSYLI